MTIPYERKTIKIDDIALDRRNYRLPRSAQGRDPLDGMLKVQRGKVVALAIDIAQNGLNPTETFLLVPMDDSEVAKPYAVLEGNRRITAMCVLANPSIAAAHVTPKELRDLEAAAANWRSPGEVECVVFPARAEAAKWITRRHAGEMGGAGLVRWGSVERARLIEDETGIKPPELAVLDFVLDSNTLDSATQEKAELDFNLTNLARVVDDAEAQKRLGLIIRSGIIMTDLHGSRMLSIAKKLVEDVARGMKVSEIDNAPLRREYLDGLPIGLLPDADTPRSTLRALVQLNPLEPEPTSTSSPGGSGGASPGASADGGTTGSSTTGAAGGTAASTGGSAGGGAAGGGESGTGAPGGDASGTGAAAAGKTGTGGGSGKGGGPRNARDPLARKTLIPKRTKIYIDPTRINLIFRELQKLQVASSTNACAVLLRVFLEFSVNVLNERVPASMPPKARELAPLLLAAVDYLGKEGALTNADVRAVRHAINAHGVSSPHAFNLFTHNYRVNPRENDLKLAWDSFEPLVAAIWGHLRSLS